MTPQNVMRWKLLIGQERFQNTHTPFAQIYLKDLSVGKEERSIDGIYEYIIITITLKVIMMVIIIYI